MAQGFKLADAEDHPWSETCPRCEGIGKYARFPGMEKPCAVCKGTGVIRGWRDYPDQYHKDVVEACVLLMGEQNREFFHKECSYEAEYEEGLTPQECAEAQRESI